MKKHLQITEGALFMRSKNKSKQNNTVSKQRNPPVVEL